MTELVLCQTCGHLEGEHKHEMNYRTGMIEVGCCWCCTCPGFVPEPPVL